MALDLLFLSEKNASTKGLIVRLLSSRSASIAELRRLLTRDYRRNVTYQAVRQAVMELETSSVLLRDGKKYRLNPLWVSELNDVVTLLNSAVKRSVPIIDGKTTQISLRNLDDLGNFILSSLEQDYFELSKDEDLYLHLDHLWIPFSDKQKRERLKRVFSKNKTHILVRGSSLGDRLLARWYRQFGTVKLGVSKSSLSQCIVHADTVVQLYFDHELQKLMDDVYRLRINLDLLHKINEMTHKEFGIQVTITRNSKIAEQMRASIVRRL